MANTHPEPEPSVLMADGKRLSDLPTRAMDKQAPHATPNGDADDRLENVLPDTASVRSRTLTTPISKTATKPLHDKDAGDAGDGHDPSDNASKSDNDDVDEDDEDGDKFQDADDDVRTQDSDMRDGKPNHDGSSDGDGSHATEEEPGQDKEEKDLDRASSHRISVSSNMDNVNLDDDDAAPPPPQPGTTHPAGTRNSQPSTDHPPHHRHADSKGSSEKVPSSIKTLSLNSITSALPSLPWGNNSQPSDPPTKSNSASSGTTSSTQAIVSAAAAAAAATTTTTTTTSTTTTTAAAAAATAPAPATAPPSRKLTSPFSWLSRSSTQQKEPPPPQPSSRRNTASSVTTMTSNPELMLGRLEEEQDGENGPNGPSRNSLKDRFQQLRLQSEVAAEMAGEDRMPVSAGLVRGLNLTLSLANPPNEEDKERYSALKPPLSPAPPSPNPSLAPGTASGVEVGPSAMSEGNVDWDLWQSVVYEGPAAVARSSAEELNRAIATGIPSAIRGVIWQVLAQSKNESLEAVYQDLSARGTDKAKDRHSNSTTLSTVSNGHLSIQSEHQVASSASSVNSEPGANGAPPPPPSDKAAEAALRAQAAAAAERKRKEKEDSITLQKLEKTIRRDMGTRTSYSKYAAAEGLQDGLFGVCKAYALFDEEVGYAQGMNFLVMPLLFNVPEDEAFCLLVRLMNHYGLRDLFINEMPGLHMRLYQFDRLLEDFEPAVYCHLHRRGISPHLYATQWFLTLFAYRFPLQLVLRIYDLILSEGLSAILRFGLVLMRKNGATLLGMQDMQQLTTFLKDKVFDVYIDKTPSAGSILENGFFGSSSSSLDKEVYHADQLVRDACEIKITPRLLKTYTTEWEDKTRAERDREAELEQLRASNAHSAVRIRRLEERIEAVDREQATMATEFVRTKVENQELRDENEGLRVQVQELRIVIEKQPVEIELAWQAERDDLMKRNARVHEENQKVEKEMAELEEELVQTKMRWAELNSQHETLNRKWSDLRRQFA